MSKPVVIETSVAGRKPDRRGKVRDIFDFGDKLIIVATDRISAFDWVLPNGIPDKGRILTALSSFWFEKTTDIIDNHLLETDVYKFDIDMTDEEAATMEGRSMLVQKAEVFPVECVVRGYLAGSGWKEYRETGRVCGVELPAGLRESDRLPEPIFTPATKAETGHDINISFEQMAEIVGMDAAKALRAASLALFDRGSRRVEARGLILSDTKFEFGLIDGRLTVVDEVLTPDSSRFWPADQYKPGRSQPSFDKQYVRDWLENSGWDKQSPPPRLPEEIVAGVRQRYIEAYERISGLKLAL
ncbi:MAG: phosphoribosylaminoimidazolesuccinocarboxamide synthase [Candidatus Hydrogenedentes bacterium]|nr:phosphoribosylaminoimidazolesuccinocarboxamide synthase [Candidatus Hydrogenedentota bacterium]